MTISLRREGVSGHDVKARVLVVDDTEQNLDLVAAILRSVADVELVLCSSADEALVALEDPDFAVALLDVYMPNVSGFDLAQRMRASEAMRAIPIIFITAAMPTAQIMFEGYEHGAVDVLFKPLAPRVVKSKVEVFKSLYLARKDLEISNRRILAAQQEAEQAGRLKDRFLANISHEIRTPLQAIMGLADSVRLEEQASEREVLLQSIGENADYLARLLGNILDVSKIKSGMLQISCPTPFTLDEMVTFLQSMFGAKSRSKGLSLTFDLPENAHGRVLRGDEIRLKQILCNLIGNSIKFTSTGGVAIRATLDEDACTLTVDVVDTGPGVPPDERENVFLPFLQLSSENHSLLGGVGLGLPLSKGLAEALGGSLVCEDTRNQESGACFRLVVPVEIAAPLEVTAAQGLQQEAPRQGASAFPYDTATHKTLTRRGLEGLRLLLAEDSPFIALFVKRVLEEAGAQVEVAENGIIAERAIRARAFDVALLDLNMPEKLGADVVRSLRKAARREAEAGTAHTPLSSLPALIAFTASAPEEAERQATAAGFDGSICKPIEREALVESILLLHRRAHARRAQPSMLTHSAR